MSRPEVLRQRDRWAETVWLSTLPAADKLVALAYADHARNGLGSVWVAVDRLVERTSLSRSGVMKCLNRLKAAGWMAVAEPSRQHRSTRYRLLVPEGAEVGEPVTAEVDLQGSMPWTAETSTGCTSGPASSPPGEPRRPRIGASGAAGGPDLSSDLSSPSSGERGADRRPSTLVESAAREAGVPDDVLHDVIALAEADATTRTSPAARLQGDTGYAERLVARVRAERTKAVATHLRTVTRHGQPECEHGTPGGASPLPSTGRPVCALCRGQRLGRRISA